MAGSSDERDVADITVEQKATLTYEVMFGHRDSATHRHVDGVVDSIAKIAQGLMLERRIDRWSLRIVLFIALLRFFGFETLQSLIHLVHP